MSTANKSERGMLDEKPINSEREMIDRVFEQLVKCGVPPERIVRGKWILRDGRQCYSADIAILDEDGKGINAVYECKMAIGDNQRIIDEVRHNMHLVMGLCKCYLVKMDCNELLVTRILPDGLKTEWKRLADIKVDQTTGGTNKTIVKFRDSDRNKVAVVGLILLTIFMVCEVHGTRFSWMVFALVLIVVVMYAAASDYRFTIRVSADGCLLSVGGDAPRK